MPTAKEIKSYLLDNGYKTEDLNAMKKDDLKNLYDGLQLGNAQLSVSPEKENSSIVPTEQSMLTEISILPTDPKWTEYVLAQFDSSELDNKNPKVDGLRRVAELLLGRFNSFTTVIECPTIANAGHATVVVRLEFTDPSEKRIVEGAADVYGGNTAKDYAVHSVATAETRAEGRALRKALRLTKVLAAEETYNAENQISDADLRIPTQMVTGLQIMAKNAKIDLHKLAIYANAIYPDDKFNTGIGNVSELTKKQGLLLSDRIVKYTTGEETIENEIKL